MYTVHTTENSWNLESLYKVLFRFQSLKHFKSFVSWTDLTDQEADYTKTSSLPPTELEVGGSDNPAVQIACGQHHTG